MTGKENCHSGPAIARQGLTPLATPTHLELGAPVIREASPARQGPARGSGCGEGAGCRGSAGSTNSAGCLRGARGRNGEGCVDRGYPFRNSGSINRTGRAAPNTAAVAGDYTRTGGRPGPGAG